MRAKPMDAEETDRARNAQLLALPGLFDTNRVVVDSYARDWARGLPVDSIAKLPAKLAAVTPASAFNATKSFVDSNGLIVVAVGDKAKVLQQLESLGRKPLELRDAAGQVLEAAKP